MDASSKFQNKLPVSSIKIMNKIKEYGIHFDYYEHFPLKTVEDSKKHRNDLLTSANGGCHIKNFYLRDRKKNNFLCVFQEDTEVNLKQLAISIKANGSLSFGSSQRLYEYLGVKPGAVSPLALITGVKNNVKLVCEKKILDFVTIYMHPLVNDRTIGIKMADFVILLHNLGCEPIWLEI